MSIWSVLIYSIARTFKSDPINNKLLKTLPRLQKITYRVLMSQECLSEKKKYYNCLTFGNVLLNLKMSSDLSYTNFRKPLFSAQWSLAPSHPNSDSLNFSMSITSSEPWYSLWATSKTFSGKCSFAQMMLPLTSQPILKGLLLNSCSICTFHQGKSSICLLGVQQKAVSTRWQHVKMNILFLSFIFLGKLLESQFVVFPITTIWTTSVFF